MSRANRELHLPRVQTNPFIQRRRPLAVGEVLPPKASLCAELLAFSRQSKHLRVTGLSAAADLVEPRQPGPEAESDRDA